MFHVSQTEVFDRLASAVRELTECMLRQEGDHQPCPLCDGKRYKRTGQNQICSFPQGDQLTAASLWGIPPDTPRFLAHPIRGRCAALLSTSREFPRKSLPLSCEARVFQGGQGLLLKGYLTKADTASSGDGVWAPVGLQIQRRKQSA